LIFSKKAVYTRKGDKARTFKRKMIDKPVKTGIINEAKRDEKVSCALRPFSERGTVQAPWCPVHGSRF